MKHFCVVGTSAQLIRINDVLNLTGLSKTTLYDRINNQLITPPVRISTRLSGWPFHEICKINNSLIAGATSIEIKQLVIELVKQRQKQHLGEQS
jgi:prophage regulatory protein